MRLGPWEIALIAMFIVILFGAKKIPEIMRGLGLGVKEFKSGLHNEDDSDQTTNDKQDKENDDQNDVFK
ncbi:MAG: twin-arginine translocase TatA/TatE family subunit [Candidatus Hatepunaea meridiana]|nr:twin-arginine translocase TatA/TatE family subunit [Candidatus Hatepunaea meridiana]